MLNRIGFNPKAAMRRAATTFSVAGLAALLAIGWARTAAAGVVDTELPVLDPGAHSYHVFTVPGVIKNNNIETEFVCTSLNTVKMRVGVEVFNAAGTLLNNVASGVGDGAQDVEPGATLTIGTANTNAIHEDEVITALTAGSVKNGSARILATSTRLTCSAFITDKFGPRFCTSSASDPTRVGLSCAADADCGTGGLGDTGCLGGATGCCQSVPASMASLKVIKKTKQRGE